MKPRRQVSLALTGWRASDELRSLRRVREHRVDGVLDGRVVLLGPLSGGHHDRGADAREVGVPAVGIEIVDVDVVRRKHP